MQLNRLSHFLIVILFLSLFCTKEKTNVFDPANHETQEYTVTLTPDSRIDLPSIFYQYGGIQMDSSGCEAWIRYKYIKMWSIDLDQLAFSYNNTHLFGHLKSFNCIDIIVENKDNWSCESISTVQEARENREFIIEWRYSPDPLVITGFEQQVNETLCGGKITPWTTNPEYLSGNGVNSSNCLRFEYDKSILDESTVGIEIDLHNADGEGLNLTYYKNLQIYLMYELSTFTENLQFEFGRETSTGLEEKERKELKDELNTSWKRYTVPIGEFDKWDAGGDTLISDWTDVHRFKITISKKNSLNIGTCRIYVDEVKLVKK